MCKYKPVYWLVYEPNVIPLNVNSNKGCKLSCIAHIIQLQETLADYTSIFELLISRGHLSMKDKVVGSMRVSCYLPMTQAISEQRSVMKKASYLQE